MPSCCPALPLPCPAPPQVGLSEMKACIEHTGGYVVQTDTFTNPIFKDSLRRMFTPAGEEGSLGLSSNATFEVHCRWGGAVGGWVAGWLGGWVGAVHGWLGGSAELR